EFNYLTLHDALPIFQRHVTPRCPPPNRSTDGFEGAGVAGRTVAVDISVAAIEVTASDRAPPRALLIAAKRGLVRQVGARFGALRSEEHTSELQSREK